VRATRLCQPHGENQPRKARDRRRRVHDEAEQQHQDVPRRIDAIANCHDHGYRQLERENTPRASNRQGGEPPVGSTIDRGRRRAAPAGSGPSARCFSVSGSAVRLPATADHQPRRRCAERPRRDQHEHDLNGSDEHEDQCRQDLGDTSVQRSTTTW
jgi:hypothetical protein